VPGWRSRAPGARRAAHRGHGERPDHRLIDRAGGPTKPSALASPICALRVHNDRAGWRRQHIPYSGEVGRCGVSSTFAL
jgi:hypothetical protein